MKTDLFLDNPIYALIQAELRNVAVKNELRNVPSYDLPSQEKEAAEARESTVWKAQPNSGKN